MMMEISLENVRFKAFHGVFPEEKIKGNEFIVDLSVEIYWDKKIPDDLDSTISYADLYEIIREEMEKTSDLIETVATRIKKKITERWEQIQGGFIKITKLHPPIQGFQGVASVKLKF